MEVVLKEGYEISVWRDLWENDHWTEERIYTIGSDTMVEPCRAFDPELKIDIYGQETFSFKIHTKYVNDYGEFEENPYINELYNEAKIKVKYLNEWHDFIIKNCSEVHEKTFSITYECNSLAMQELSKSGYDITFSEDLSNNVNPIDNFMEATLEDSGWIYDRNGVDLREYSEDQAYTISWVQSAILPTITPFTIEWNNNKYTKVPGQTIQLVSGDQIFIGYNERTRGIGLTSGNIEAIYVPANTAIQTDENFVITNGIHCDISCIYAEVSTICNYRVKHYTKTPVQIYNTNLEKYVDVYSKPNDSTALNYYGFETYIVQPQILVASRSTSTIVISLANPPTKAAVYTYWKREHNETPQAWTLITEKTTNSSYCIADLDKNKTYDFKIQPFDYLSRPLDANGNVIENVSESNPGIQYEISNIQPLNDTITVNSATTYCENFSNVNIKLLWRKTKVSSTDWLAAGWINTTFDDVDYLYDLYYDNSDVDLTTTRYLTLTPIISTGQNIYNVVPKDTFIDIKNRLLKGEIATSITFNIGATNYNASYLVLLNQQLNGTTITISTIVENRSELRRNHRVYANDSIDVNVEYLDDNTIQVLQTTYSNNFAYQYYKQGDESTLYSTLPTGYELEYTYEKQRTFATEKSNRFNITQELSELFAIWCRYIIEHYTDGRIKLDANQRQKKFVRLVDQYGAENHIGFVYGLNVKKITRNLKSDEIVTKLFVEDLENATLDAGYCTITNASDNPNKQNFLLDFSYYIKKGLLDADKINNDLYVYSENSSLGYYPRLKDYTIAYNAAYTVAYGNGESSLYNQKLVYENNILVNESKITSLLEKKTAAITGGSSASEIAEIETEITAEKQNLTTYKAKLLYIKTELSKEEEIIKTNLANIQSLHGQFYKKYSRFIQEGTWQGDSYVNDNIYFYDAQKVITESAFPRVSYSLDIIDIHNLIDAETNWDYSPYAFHVGDISCIKDTQYFGEQKQQVVISSLTYKLDEPQNNSIEIRNYTVDFQDIFSKLTASVQSLTLNEKVYAKSANFTSDGSINYESLQKSFNKNRDLALSNANSTVTHDNTGITLTDGSSVVKLLGGGIILSSDGGNSWKTGIYGGEINTALLKAGTIDASKINIMSNTVGSNPTYIWNTHGLNAYTYSGTTINYNKKVTFNQYGIYGYYDAAGLLNKGDTDGITSSNIRSDPRITFSLSSDGLYLNVRNNLAVSRGQVENATYVFANADATQNYYIDNLKNPLKPTDVSAKLYFSKETINNVVFYRFLPEHYYFTFVNSIKTQVNTYAIRDASSLYSQYFYSTLTGDSSNYYKWNDTNFTITTGEDGYGNIYKFTTGKNYYYAKEDSCDVNTVINVNNKFKVFGDGSIIATNGSFSGHVEATSGSFSGHVEATSGSFNGNLRAQTLYLGTDSTDVKSQLQHIISLIPQEINTGSFILKDASNNEVGALKITSASSATYATELSSGKALRITANDGTLYMSVKDGSSEKAHISMNTSGKLTLQADSAITYQIGGGAEVNIGTAVFG